MNVFVFSSRNFEIPVLEQANKGKHHLTFFSARLSQETCALAKGADAVVVFSNDDVGASTIAELVKYGVKMVAYRAAGYNTIDLDAAKRAGLKVARVPAYSPFAIAEHTVALMLALNRKLIKAHRRVQDLNFSLDGLVGFDMHGKTVGVIGVGKIGEKLVHILNGFGCKVLAYDVEENALLKDQVEYTSMTKLLNSSDIISLHVPLSAETKYMIDKDQIQQMKRGVMLINTSRGGLIHTKAVIDALKTGQIGYLGIDVYEEEAGLFFKEHEEDMIADDVIARLMTFKNVLITGHQAFLTQTALENIAATTVKNLDDFAEGKSSENFLL